MKIDVQQLTICHVQPDGTALEFSFIDGNGQPATLRLPFEHAQSFAMTLPHLLTAALRRSTGDPNSRYVFPLGDWRIELASDQDCLLTTLATEGGFEVTFGIPAEACGGLAWALKHEAGNLAADRAAAAEACGSARIN